MRSGLNRRDLLRRLTLVPLGAALAILNPTALFASVLKRPPRIDVATILTTSFTLARESILGGATWASHELNHAQAAGQITLAPLGPYVAVDGQRFDVLSLSIPMVWTAKENTFPYENDRIALAAGLIKNAIDSHDDLLIERLRGYRLIISPLFHYSLGSVQQLADGAYVCVLYTVFAAIPLERQ